MIWLNVFGVSRSDASLPYTLTMLGFGLGGILMGKLADRFGVMVPMVLYTVWGVFDILTLPVGK